MYVYSEVANVRCSVPTYGTCKLTGTLSVQYQAACAQGLQSSLIDVDVIVGALGRARGALGTPEGTTRHCTEPAHFSRSALRPLLVVGRRAHTSPLLDLHTHYRSLHSQCFEIFSLDHKIKPAFLVLYYKHKFNMFLRDTIFISIFKY